MIDIKDVMPNLLFKKGTLYRQLSGNAIPNGEIRNPSC